MTDSKPLSLHNRKITALVLAIVTVVSAAFIGNSATLPNIATWYAHLNKPPLNPPNWVFGPVWSILYVFMIIAFWRILTRPDPANGRLSASLWFLAQMIANAGWSVAFFGQHSPAAGLSVIIVMWVLIIMTILQFARIDRLASWLLVPYLMWVSFAAYLNAGVFWLNR